MSAIDDTVKSTRSVTSGWVAQFRTFDAADIDLWVTAQDAATLQQTLDWVQHERQWDRQTAETRFLYRAFHPRTGRSIIV